MIIVVSGKEIVDSELKRFEEAQDSLDRHEGWRYFIDKAEIRAGTDPAAATREREALFDAREAKALRENETLVAARANGKPLGKRVH